MKSFNIRKQCCMKFIILSAFCLLGSGLLAQNTRTSNAPVPPKPVYQSTKKDSKGFLGLSKKKNTSLQYNEVTAFRERLQKVYKEKAKEEKLSQKKRYKDPTYFGHKRKPKKRPVGKQKFCSICRIKH